MVDNAPGTFEVIAVTLLFSCSEGFFIVGVGVPDRGGIQRRYEGIDELGEGIVNATWARRYVTRGHCDDSRDSNEFITLGVASASCWRAVR